MNRKELFLVNARIDSVISSSRYYMQRKAGPGQNRGRLNGICAVYHEAARMPMVAEAECVGDWS